MMQERHTQMVPSRQAVHFSPMQPSEAVAVLANSAAINTTSKTQQHHTARLIKRFTEIIN